MNSDSIISTINSLFGNLFSSIDNSIYKAGLTIDEVKEFRIDNTNYSEFIEYEYLFKKKDNNYYLVRVKER